MNEAHTEPVDYEAQAKGLIEKTLLLENQLRVNAEKWKAKQEKLECDLVSAQSESNWLRGRLAAVNEEMGSLRKKEFKYQENALRQRNTGAALTLLFLIASFVMAFLAVGEMIPLWQVSIPMIAALGVGVVTGWCE